jgi:hypothetical protein
VAKSISKKARQYVKGFFYGLHPLTAQIHPCVKKYWVVRRSFISNRWKYCYFRIPKCANSTIARSLFKYEQGSLYDLSADPRGRVAKQSSDRLLSARALSADALCSKYFLFTFARNPYERLLSAYLDKIARLDNTGFDSIRKLIRSCAGTKKDVTFADFAQYLEKSGLYQDPHWIPQTAMLPVAVSRIHYVGRIEHLDADLEYVINQIFGQGTYQMTFTRQDRHTNSTAKIMAHYDKNLFERVYKLYEVDFQAFSYPKIWSAGTD